MKTFGLINENNEYIVAAGIISDNNIFSGVDIIKFGENINIIQERITINNTSIFEQFDKTIEIFKRYYIYEEIISKLERTIIEKIPFIAFREAFANALIHRTWDVNENVRISFYNNKILISSPGGLKNGISYDEYLHGQISRPRNPILANVFYRLKFIEMFGTGILRINESYANSITKPKYMIYDNSISIELPLLVDKPVLSQDENQIINYLITVDSASSLELSKELNYSKDKVLRIMKKLITNNYVRKIGNNKATRYKIS